MNHEQAGDMRSMILRGVIEASYDDGPMQLVDVRTSDDVLRTGIEVAQLYGFAHNPPPGGTVILMAIGADPGDYMALPAFHDGARFGGMEPGEAGIYRWPDGTRIRLLGGGAIEILAATKVVIGTGRVEISAPEGIAITGDTTIDGNLVVTKDVQDKVGTMQTMRDQYNPHTHGGPGPSIHMG